MIQRLAAIIAIPFAIVALRALRVGDLGVADNFGASECYVYYDGEPCYDIEFDQTSYRLTLVNHSDESGKVLSVDIIKTSTPQRSNVR